MNIPLNIDWQQILLHLFNFAILTAGLYWLLYKPVKDFIEKRTGYYQQLEEQANSRLEHAAVLETDYQNRLQGVETEIGRRRAKADKETEQASDMKLEEARKQAGEVIEAARKTAILERTKILADAQKEITELAVAATEKLLEESKTSAFDQFLQAAGRGETND
ncbi:ATP synthase F0 subunit B [Enterocloster bolteae]|uniref:ATP synthase F0 subunit B n=1 Tax=Enterocloster bolteae TaxID=208479 RepID=UPI00210DAE7B|nr:ATP synthase F0 subunit B [Enterocloster bolteae]MCQ5144447.1 ATP synthase F0 subunit B [Enterocloster bolteae]